MPIILALFLLTACVAVPPAVAPIVESVGGNTTLTTCPLPGENVVELEHRHGGVAVAYVAYTLDQMPADLRHVAARHAAEQVVAGLRVLAALRDDQGQAGVEARAVLARLQVVLAMR